MAGVEDDVVGACAAEVGGHRLAPLGLERGVPLAHARARAVHLDEGAGLGVDEREVAGARQRGLARVAHLDRHHAVPRAERGERRSPAVLPEIRDHDDQPRAARHPAGPHQRTGEGVRGRIGIGGHALAHHALDRELRMAAAARREQQVVRSTGAQEPGPAAAARRQPRDRDRHSLRHVGLEPQRGAERHRR